MDLDAAAQLQGSANVGALAKVAYAPTSAIGGSATLVASISSILRSSITLSGMGTASAETGLRFDGAALLQGFSNLTSQAQYLVRASLNGLSNLTAQISLQLGTTTLLSGEAVVEGSSRVHYAPASGLSAVGTQSGDASVLYRSGANLSGSATMQGTALGPHEAAADVVGSATLSGSAKVSYQGSTLMVTDSFLTSYPIVYNPLVAPPINHTIGVWVDPYAGLRVQVPTATTPSNTLTLTPKGPEIVG